MEQDGPMGVSYLEEAKNPDDKGDIKVSLELSVSMLFI